MSIRTESESEQSIDSEQMEKWSRLSPFALIPMSLASDDEASASWKPNRWPTW